MTTTSKLVLALAGAVAAGVIIGMIAAPEKGVETRKKVKDKAGKLVDGLSRLFSHSGNGEMAQDVQQSGLKRGKEASTTMG